jgi:rRNA maturation endonuclease Nob1
MTVYICCKCLFCFERFSEPEICPDCGAARVRDAMPEEAAEYERNKRESRKERES